MIYYIIFEYKTNDYITIILYIDDIKLHIILYSLNTNILYILYYIVTILNIQSPVTILYYTILYYTILVFHKRGLEPKGHEENVYPGLHQIPK